ncbi:rhamnan synthesis F family protein [Lichenihabitans sp. Uapishka_5]|uniref:rhamnan synthesis F family protein n=1 Tax=Lichenihabitans sp. Uapishka_5 TaxID=3037302 RepID=UPI0029E7FD7F|nr:rhamnan synthesis F family protein [Lichenihabitans sp. Uapishka_5]MDX7952944.1 rhamnan synthesis F family protein [Lichenihabitans sp. Uapishka_5]
MIDLSALSYVKSEEDGLWRPDTPRASFGYSDGPEERSVREAIEGAADRSIFSRDLGGCISSWVTRYHLSPARSGLLWPVAGMIRGDVLEIGAGFGAITRALGEAGHSVTAFEGSPFRAAAAALRCRDLPNVQVACDDLANLSGTACFDTIIMVGVLEYARAYFGGGGVGDPVDRMLGHVGSLLRPGGRLVLAIENQLGLKYFAGYPEDHLGEPFAGVEDRYAADGPVTFGHRDLAARLDGAGLSEHRWLYAFPDYKLPAVILTDRASEPGSGFNSASLIAQAVRRDVQRPAALPFSAGAAWRPVARNGLIADLANSFLVVASREAIPESNTVAYYLALDRPAPHGKAVHFVQSGDGIVAETLTASGAVVSTDAYRMGVLWHDRLADLVLHPAWTLQDLAGWTAPWWEAVEAMLRSSGAASEGLAAATILPSSFIDAIPRNLIVGDEGAHFIDQEWSIASSIEAGYLFYRAVRDAFLTLDTCAAPAADVPPTIDELAIRLAFGVGLWMTRHDVLRYKDFERQFQAHVNGTTASSDEIGFGNERLPIRPSFADMQRSDADLAELRRHAANLEELVAERDGHAARLQEALEATQHESVAAATRDAEMISQGKGQIEQLEERVAEHAGHVARLQEALEAARRESAAAVTRDAETISQGKAHSEQLESRVAALDNVVAAQAVELRTRGAALDHLEGLVETFHHHHGAAAGQVHQAEGEANRLRGTIEAMRVSASWRVMGPYRVARRSLRRLVSRRVAPGEGIDAMPPQDALPVSPPFELSRPPGSTGPRRSAEADLIAASGLFDEDAYSGTEAAWAASIDPIDHYLAIGEPEGLRPSSKFDPVFYCDRYPDIATAGMSPLLHFVRAGEREARRPRPAVDELTFSPVDKTDGRRVVVMLVHEATRTGAPLLGFSIATDLAKQHLIVSVVLRSGPLDRNFADVSAAFVGPMDWHHWHPAEMSRVAERLVKTYDPLYAVANSIETSQLIPHLSMRGVPCVALIHEFASYTRPLSKLSDAFDWASDIVFPAHVVAESSFKTLPHLSRRNGVHILAQGRVDPPAVMRGVKQTASLSQTLLPRTIDTVLDGSPHVFTILGAGTVDIRKGVDVFVAVAAACKKIAPDLELRFVWIGGGYDPETDLAYSAYLSEHIARSGVGSTLRIMKPTTDLNPVYAASDLFLMSSRLDPQPNVAIDALSRGLPVVCFAGASGTAEVLSQSAGTKILVAPYLDATAAAEIICRFARDPIAQEKMRSAVALRARQVFDMGHYTAQLDAWGRKAAAALRTEDLNTLLQADLDAAMVVPPSEIVRDGDSLAKIVRQQWASVGISEGQTGNNWFRRGYAGFHPQIYALHHSQACVEQGETPLAHWLRAGKPAGPWARSVLSPAPAASPSDLRVALHGHFFYPDLIVDFLARLNENATSCDLYLTTDTEEKAAELANICNGRKTCRILVNPNKGRDIGPFLHVLRNIQTSNYDLVGHVHGKKSNATDASMGERWRDFLWSNLVGPSPMLDAVAAACVANPKIGLIMAEDPHLVGWDGNRAIGEALAERMKLEVALDDVFDFPLGTMFWARPEALSPLAGLNLDWSDFPAEPLPYDATMLHAVERLLPFVVRSAGFDVVGIRTPGSNW